MLTPIWARCLADTRYWEGAGSANQGSSRLRASDETNPVVYYPPPAVDDDDEEEEQLEYADGEDGRKAKL